MIVVAGESLIDLIVDPDARVTAVPGGGPYNTARTVARLGQPCAYVGRLSTDRFGELLYQHLCEDGVVVASASRTEAPTTLALAELDAMGAAMYRFYVDGTSAPTLTLADAIASLDRRPAILHVGTLGLVFEPMASSLESLVERVGKDVLVMLDPNCRPLATPDPMVYRTRIERVAARADVVKASVDDLHFLYPGRSAVAAAKELLSCGPSVVLVTDAGSDVRIVRAGGETSLPVPKVTVADTVGSGDAFGGGFLAWWSAHHLTRAALDNASLVERATQTAIRVASLTCQRAGADPPTLVELGGWA